MVSPDENTGVGCHALLQGVFLIQGSNLRLLCLLHWQLDSLLLVLPEKPVSTTRDRMDPAPQSWLESMNEDMKGLLLALWDMRWGAGNSSTRTRKSTQHRFLLWLRQKAGMRSLHEPELRVVWISTSSKRGSSRLISRRGRSRAKLKNCQ